MLEISKITYFCVLMQFLFWERVEILRDKAATVKYSYILIVFSQLLDSVHIYTPQTISRM